MDVKDFFETVVPQVLAVAAKNKLEVEYKPDFNDEIDFVIDLNSEAVDYLTLENPTCTCLEAYLTVKLPRVSHDEDEVKRINEATGENFTIDQMVSDYNYAASQLMGVAQPQYLLGVENGHVDKLMWCIWN